MRQIRMKQAQSGAVLIVAMVFLLLFALTAISIYKGSLSSVQAIGNMQWRDESIAAANEVLDRVVSNTDFADLTQLAKNTTPYQVDVNGDGVDDVTVSFPSVMVDGVARRGARCMRIEPIPTSLLNPDIPEDVSCLGSSSQGQTGFGIDTGSGTTIIEQSTPLCANTEWSIRVNAQDAVTNTSVDIVQGVGVRVLTTSVDVCN